MAKKIVVFTTITYSTEYDLEKLKAEGVTTKKQLLDYAKQNYDENRIVDFDAKIHDKYDDEDSNRPKPRKGVGSY
jgi:hypothetical protein